MLESAVPEKVRVVIGLTVADAITDVNVAVLAANGRKSTQSLRSNVEPFDGEKNKGISAVLIAAVLFGLVSSIGYELAVKNPTPYD